MDPDSSHLPHPPEASARLEEAARQNVDALAGRLDPSSRVGVLSGAGISAASGIPTFRGDGGYWKNVRAEDLATPDGFHADPSLVWEWYGWRRDRIRAASPNAAHLALVDLARRVASLAIVTQNVDGLHAAALPEGGPAVEIVEMHGSIWRMRCTGCGVEREDRRPGPPAGDLPHCACGAMLRPAVVWFGEALDARALDRAAAVATGCDLFLVVGTSAVVQPAASFASVAARAGATVAEFNLEATGLVAGLDVAVQAPAEVALPALIAAFDARYGRSA